jgi:hypothetical protein
MRAKLTRSGLTVHAVAGTHVVLLGLDLTPARRKGCLGFAIQRHDHTEGEVSWLRGMKTFEAIDPGLGPGGTASSREHPFQTFQWADYSAKPGHDYTYTVVPLRGKPEALTEGAPVSVRLHTETEIGARHSVWFNRGSIASQEYARRFLNKPPDEIPGGAAYTWLSRGLLEALLAFVARANGPRYRLVGAIYEFQWPAVLHAIRRAARTGARVRILYDAIRDGNGPAEKNLSAVRQAEIKGLTMGRTEGKLMHNKFLILIRDGQPQAVWTGSTNITENGLFGHSNLGQVIEDPGVAQAYLAYWQALEDDPTTPEMKDWTGTANAAPPDPWVEDQTVVFSPRRGTAVLDWYADIARGASKALFMTFAFGMHTSFTQVYQRDDSVLRFALMEKEGNGPGLEEGRRQIDRLRRRPNVVVAIGNNIALNSFDRWLKERSKLSREVNVRFVHTKYMLVDPLGPHPVVVTGSANFSRASTDTNDENMIVIRNDPRVADIYLGEFMRLFSHFAFREAVKIAQARGEDPEVWRPNVLAPTDAWQKDYYREGSARFLRRRYFAGK